MPEEKKAVENLETAAPQAGVENNETNAPKSPTQSEVDLAAELEKTRLERDNYKRGLLKAKGKSEEIDDIDEDKIQSIIDARIKEALESSKNEELEKREAELIEKLIKENKELKLAQANRSQVSSSGQGGGYSEQKPTEDKFFSAEQLAELKKRGVDPEKVKENILKNRR